MSVSVNNLASAFSATMNSLATVAKSMAHLEHSFQNVAIQARVEQSHVTGILAGMPAIGPEIASNPLAKQLGLDVAIETLGVTRSMLGHHADGLAILGGVAQSQADQVAQLAASFSAIAIPSPSTTDSPQSTVAETPVVAVETPQAKTVPSIASPAEVAPAATQDQETAWKLTGPFPLEVAIASEVSLAETRADLANLPPWEEDASPLSDSASQPLSEKTVEVVTSAANPPAEAAPTASLFPVADDVQPAEPTDSVRFSDLAVGDWFEFTNAKEWWKQGLCFKSDGGRFTQEGKTTQNKAHGRSSVRRMNAT